jgi:anti-sigma factor RsiW
MHPNTLVINDYVDAALDPAERADVERHLAGCVECRQLVDDLREVRRQTAALQPMEPPSRVWTQIDRALRQNRPSPHPIWQWLAAAAMLVIGTAVGVRYVTSSRPAAPAPAVAAAANGGGAVAAPGSNDSADNTDNRELAKSVEDDLLQAEQHYQRAITGLEQIANADKGALDPHTAATLQKNLSVIDQAINESRAALKAQPTSEPAQQSLLDSFKSKIALLQETVALINEMRKGNDAGAARIASGLKQKS